MTDRDESLPKKILNTPTDMSRWQISDAYNIIYSYIETVNNLITGKSNSQASHVSAEILCIVDLIKELKSKIDDFPPEEQPQRFGNKKFAVYYYWVKNNLDNLMIKHIQSKTDKGKTLSTKSLKEISIYLLESFGHPQRIDYGSGHELSFIAFLICLNQTHYLDKLLNNKADLTNSALVVFPEYLEFVRKLQNVYKFEPAGSRGVHALDDFQFIPFIWGSSQLINNPEIFPEHIPVKEYAIRYKKENLMFSCINYIFESKTGPFAEHSNTLYNISSVQGWPKVNQGMLKMYKGEVLNKFPVVQHFLFGTYFKLNQQSCSIGSQVDLPARCC